MVVGLGHQNLEVTEFPDHVRLVEPGEAGRQWIELAFADPKVQKSTDNETTYQSILWPGGGDRLAQCHRPGEGCRRLLDVEGGADPAGAGGGNRVGRARRAGQRRASRQRLRHGAVDRRVGCRAFRRLRDDPRGVQAAQPAGYGGLRCPRGGGRG